MESFYFCVNKIDLLKNYKEFTVKNYIYNYLKKKKINILFKNIFLVSAKTGLNIKKLIYTIYIRSKRAQSNRKQKWEKNIKKGNHSDIESMLIENRKTMENMMNEKQEDVKDEELQRNLEEALGENLEDDLEENLEDDLEENLEDDLEENLEENLEDDLEENIDDKNEFTNVKNFVSKKEKPHFSKNINIYTVGNANSGKSSFINYLIRSTKNKNNKNFFISNSIIPGTTLKNIKIKLNNKITIIDTPGIISKDSLLYYLNFEELKYVVCRSLKKKIRSFYINEKDFIFIGGLMYIEILKIKKFYSVLSFFISDTIPIIKRKNFLKDPKEYIREKIKKKFLMPPLTIERFNQISNFKEHYFNINNFSTNDKYNSYDVHIQGLGFLTFYSFQNIEFKIYVHQNVEVVARESLMSHEKKFNHLNFVKSK